VRHVKLLIAATALLACAADASAQTVQSVYTDLSAKNCRTLKSNASEGEYYEGEGPGVAGYKLILEEGDLRQNVAVVTPRGEKHSLDLWTVVGSSFSTVGAKAEWRMRRQGDKSVPTALIVRYNLSDPENSSKTTSYLVVSKITPDEICATQTIPPGANANAEARKAADDAASKACLQQ
jgi:hypothetical protein